MGQRLGGLCVGACDSDGAMRSVFFATYGKQSLENLKLMGTDPRTLRAADVVCCGFCCKPFTPCGLQKGWEDETFGDNYDLMVDGTPRSVGSNHGTSQAAPDLLLTPSAPRIGAALEARRQAGVLDRCLLVENVPNLLRFLSPERLARLSATGWHYKIYVVAAPFFGCVVPLHPAAGRTDHRAQRLRGIRRGGPHGHGRSRRRAQRPRRFPRRDT